MPSNRTGTAEAPRRASWQPEQAKASRKTDPAIPLLENARSSERAIPASRSSLRRSFPPRVHDRTLYDKGVKRFRILWCFSVGLALAQPAADPAATARKALDLLLGGKYADLTPMFTPEMKKDLSEAALTKLGAQLQGFGVVSKIDEPSVQKTGANTIIVFPVHFEKQNINA